MITVLPTERPAVESTENDLVPDGTSGWFKLRVVPLTVLRFPDPVTLTRVYCDAAVARRRVPVVEELPAPLRTIPLLVIRIVLPI